MGLKFYACKNIKCGKEFQRQSAGVRNPERVYCSRECKNIHEKDAGLNTGKNNSNYRHGFKCNLQFCECGREKDSRSLRCSVCSHKGFSKGMKRFVDEDIFTEDSLVKGIRYIVLSRNLVEYKCKICGLGPEWNNKKLILQLDHINGINTDHRLENLRFLCPNCHSQTETYGGKNKNKKRLTKEMVNGILVSLCTTELSIKEIANLHRTNPRMVSLIMKGERWGHVTVDGIIEMRERRKLEYTYI